MNKTNIAIIFLNIFLYKICLASDITQIDRYLTTSNKTQLSQVNLLSQTIHVRFTRNIQTVGDAINYLLQFSGYSLLTEKERSIELNILLKKPLPVIDRNLGPISLSDALTTLAGSAYYLTQDPVNRTVDFKLKTAYQKFLHNPRG